MPVPITATRISLVPQLLAQKDTLGGPSGFRHSKHARNGAKSGLHPHEMFVRCKPATELAVSKKPLGIGHFLRPRDRSRASESRFRRKRAGLSAHLSPG